MKKTSAKGVQGSLEDEDCIQNTKRSFNCQLSKIEDKPQRCTDWYSFLEYKYAPQPCLNSIEKFAINQLLRTNFICTMSARNMAHTFLYMSKNCVIFSKTIHELMANHFTIWVPSAQCGLKLLNTQYSCFVFTLRHYKPKFRVSSTRRNADLKTEN